jgi:hypothetical protein
MATAFKIDKGIPVPDRQGGHGNSKYPMANMEVGDSFFVPWGEDRLRTRSVLSNAVAAFHLRNKPKRFTTHREEGGIRVWRTA